MEGYDQGRTPESPKYGKELLGNGGEAEKFLKDVFFSEISKRKDSGDYLSEIAYDVCCRLSEADQISKFKQACQCLNNGFTEFEENDVIRIFSEYLKAQKYAEIGSKHKLLMGLTPEALAQNPSLREEFHYDSHPDQVLFLLRGIETLDKQERRWVIDEIKSGTISPNPVLAYMKKLDAEEQLEVFNVFKKLGLERANDPSSLLSSSLVRNFDKLDFNALILENVGPDDKIEGNWNTSDSENAFLYKMFPDLITDPRARDVAARSRQWRTASFKPVPLQFYPGEVEYRRA